MFITLWLLLISSGVARPEGDARRLVKTSKYRWGSEDDLIKSLSSSEDLEDSRNSKRMLGDSSASILDDPSSDLIFVEDQNKLSKILNSGDSSRIRSLIELYKNKKNRPSRNDNERQLPRHGRQEFREPRQIEESCETTGYETQIREDCKTLVETVCNNVTVTRFRPDIDEKCTTRIDQKCRPTKTDIPQRQCTPRYEKRCETHYQTIEEKSYNEECEEEINHVCKEHVTVPVPVEVPYPVEAPYPDYEPEYPRPNYVPTTPYPRQPKSYEANPHPTVSQYKSQDPYASYSKEPAYVATYPQPSPSPPYNHHDPTPIPRNLIYPPYPEPQGVTISPHGAPSPSPRYSRTKREGEAASESEPQPDSDADGDPQFGNILYGNLFKRIIDKAGSSTGNTGMSERQKLKAKSRGPKILGGIVNLNPSSIKEEGKNKERFGRLQSDINNLRVSQGTHNNLLIGRDSSNEFSNILRVNGELGNVLGGPITQSPSILQRQQKFSNILIPENQDFGPLGGNLRGKSPSSLGKRFRGGSEGVTNILSDEHQGRTLEERVRDAMFNILKDAPELGGAFKGFHFDTDDSVAITNIKSGTSPEEHIVHATIEHDPLNHPHIREQLIQNHDIHHQTIHHSDLHPHIHHHHPDLQVLHQEHQTHHSHHEVPEPAHPDVHLSKPVPTVTIVELPAEPGCRSFSTKTCRKVPIVVPKKVPYEECRKVPAVDCFFVLKTVDDIECSPTSVEDCTSEAIEVPYLDKEEVCEDIEFDDCVDVEEQVPIQICKNVDPNRTPIINREIAGTSKRKGARKTGEVSRPSRLGSG